MVIVILTILGLVFLIMFCVGGIEAILFIHKYFDNLFELKLVDKALGKFQHSFIQHSIKSTLNPSSLFLFLWTASKKSNIS